MSDKVKIAAKWDDEENVYNFNVLVNGKFVAECYTEDSAYAVAFQQFGIQLEVEYD